MKLQIGRSRPRAISPAVSAFPKHFSVQPTLQSTASHTIGPAKHNNLHSKNAAGPGFTCKACPTPSPPSPVPPPFPPRFVVEARVLSWTTHLGTSKRARPLLTLPPLKKRPLFFGYAQKHEHQQHHRTLFSAPPNMPQASSASATAHF